MPEYIVSLANGLSKEQYAAAKKHAEEQGGTITDTFDREGIAPGFVVSFPADAVNTMEKAPNVVGVESNGVMRTQ